MVDNLLLRNYDALSLEERVRAIEAKEERKHAPIGYRSGRVLLVRCLC